MGTGSVEWLDLAAGELGVRVLHDVLQLRCRVFVVEQECAYLDVDGRDLEPGTRHVLALRRSPTGALGGVLAASRLLPGEGAVHIGRVVVAPEVRGSGLGRELVRRSIEACARHWPGRPLQLAAQAHLEGFYAEFGFEAVGAPYDEDGIPHVDMRRA